MSDYDELSDDDRHQLADALLRMGQWESHMAFVYRDAWAEADMVLDALDAGRCVMSPTGWGADEYVRDLFQLVEVSAVFPPVAWWRDDGDAA